MKLRIRAAGGASSATFKVDVPPSCSLQGLESAIAETLKSRGIPVPRSLRISLNKKQAIQGHPSDLISQFGICSGDLLFYFERSDMPAEAPGGLDTSDVSINLKGSQAQEIHRDPLTVSTTGNSLSMDSSGSDMVSKDVASMRRELCAAAATRRAFSVVNPPMEDNRVDPANLTNVAEGPGSSSLSSDTSADMHIEGQGLLHNEEDSDLADSGQGIPSNSIPGILQRILNAEHGSASRPSDFLCLAVHAVMLETGFIAMNAVEEGHTLPGGWYSGGFANICYTLKDMPNATNGNGSVILKSLTLGGNVVICGLIPGSGLPLRKLSLLTSKHIIGNVISHDDPISSFSDIFELWKCAKDELSLPLLAALCEMVGLPVPSSLLVIPTELKMKIFEYLPAVDLAKLGCTCFELRHLCANDELWKKLFYHDFGNSSAAQQLQPTHGWKSAYASNKKRKLERKFRVSRPFYGMASRPRFPGIIGGDYDIHPCFGRGPFRGGGGFHRFGGARGPLGGLHGKLRDEDFGNNW